MAESRSCAWEVSAEEDARRLRSPNSETERWLGLSGWDPADCTSSAESNSWDAPRLGAALRTAADISGLEDRSGSIRLLWACCIPEA